DPYEVIEKLSEHKDKLSIIYRVIPIDKVVDPYVEIVAEEVAGLVEERIPQDRTYRINLRGRLYWKETRMPAHTMDAIKVIAEKINRPVSLTHPDYVVYIRSVKLYHRKRVATITVTEPSRILSLKSKRP
ncbi:MAG: hypothetical protein J7L82_00825, partial [Staphylothermus sp.]|nr:hypothetical protein [Staphylothermus sp.]